MFFNLYFLLQENRDYVPSLPLGIPQINNWYKVLSSSERLNIIIIPNDRIRNRVLVCI